MNKHLDIEILRAHSFDKNREFLYTHPEYKPNLWQILKLRYYLIRYNQGYSVAAIIKHKEFFGLDFYVNKNVLIPRPETEMMVENAIEEIKKIQDKFILIDVGTGSGCIPISILKSISTEHVKTYAADISKKALRVAKKNAARHNVKINFVHTDLLKSVLPYLSDETVYQLVITANLPYLTQEQLNSEPSIQKEPKIALVADDTIGLSIYKKLLEQVQQINHKVTLFLEIDPAQAGKIYPLIKQTLPLAEIEVKKDLSGLDRLVIIKT